jgi:hypothetical protein
MMRMVIRGTAVVILMCAVLLLLFCKLLQLLSYLHNSLLHLQQDPCYSFIGLLMHYKAF